MLLLISIQLFFLLSTFGLWFCNHLVDTFVCTLLKTMIYSLLLFNRLFKYRNVIHPQRFLCCIQCGQMRNWCVENLVAVLAAATQLTTEPRNTAALCLQVGLNLVSYVYLHKKGVNYPLKKFTLPTGTAK